MAKITKEELLKIARLSHIAMTEEESQRLVDDIDNVLTYAARVTEIAQASEEPIKKNENVMRKDVIIPTPVDPLLHLAPERIDNYYVVPVIIEDN